MSNLDEYLEMLYDFNAKTKVEESQNQIDSTNNILLLCCNVLNLEILIQNSTLMGALTRVLQEEYKRSVMLTFNILRIFLAFSNFSEMHSLLADYKIGSLTLKVFTISIGIYYFPFDLKLNFCCS